MPDPRPSERTSAQRQADHAGLARLSDTLVPALVQKLTGSGLGELEVREGDWKVRLRRPPGAAVARRERPRTGTHTPGHAPGHAAARPTPAGPATSPDPTRVGVASPAVGVFRRIAAVGTRLRSGDRIGVVDLLGIPQDVVSPIDGILVDLTAETGDPVEYGEEVAFVAEPVAERQARADEAGTGATDGTADGGGTAAGGEG